jgi:hypothetical protein
MPLMTPAIQEKLYRETDARFDAQTGYKPGQKLNPKDPKDAAFVPVWIDIYNKVKAQWSAGKLVYTYDHPIVMQAIQTAHELLEDAAHHVEDAIAAVVPDDKNAHAAKAADAHARANKAVQIASSYQPPTVSPPLVQHAANGVYDQLLKNREASRARGAHAPDLTFGHATPAAPAVPSDASDASAPAADPASSPAPSPVNPVVTTRDAIDAQQAAHAPENAAAAHDQSPAPDAPQPDKGSIGTTAIVIGGCFAAIMLASIVSPSRKIGRSFGKRAA